MRFLSILILAAMISPSKTRAELKIEYNSFYADLYKNMGIIGIFPGTISSGFAPILVPLNVIESINKNSEDTTIDLGSLDLAAGWLAIQIGTQRLAKYPRAFLIVNQSTMLKKISKEIGAPPKRVLYINLHQFRGSEMALYRSSAFRYWVEYERKKIGTYIDLKGIPSDSASIDRALISQIKQIPPGTKFDRIEINGHGSPGKLYVLNHDVTKLLENALSEQDLAAANANIILSGCNVARKVEKEFVGQKFMKEFGEKILKDGGRVFASPKVINELNITGKVVAPLQKMIGISNLNMWRLSLLIPPVYTEIEKGTKPFPDVISANIPKNKSCEVLYKEIQ